MVMGIQHEYSENKFTVQRYTTNEMKNFSECIKVPTINILKKNPKLQNNKMLNESLFKFYMYYTYRVVSFINNIYIRTLIY